MKETKPDWRSKIGRESGWGNPATMKKVHDRLRKEQRGIWNPENIQRLSEQRRANKTGFFDKKISSAAGRKGGPKAGRVSMAQKWMSLRTGLISSACGVARHHKSLGCETTSHRIQLTNEQYEALIDLTQEQRLIAMEVNS